MRASGRVVSDRRFEDFYLFDYPKLVATLRLVTGDDDTAVRPSTRRARWAWERLRRGRRDRSARSVDSSGRSERGAVAGFGAAYRERRACARLEARAAPTDPDLPGAVADAIDIRAALAQLPRRQREVVVLFYFLDESVETIAGELEVPTGTVKAALRIGLALFLRNCSANVRSKPVRQRRERHR